MGYINFLEIRRQLLHIAIGTISLFLIIVKLLRPIHIFAIVVLSSFLSVMSKQVQLPVVSWFLKNFERDKDRSTFPGRGFISFFVGILLTVQLFPENIAYASIMILTLGDSVSNLLGRHFGKLKHPMNGHKSIEGNVFGGLAGALAALFFVPPLIGFFGSLGAMFIEAIQFKMNEIIVDDNIIVPLSSGALMLLLT